MKDDRKSSRPLDGDSCEVMDRFASLVDQNNFDELGTVLPTKKGWEGVVGCEGWIASNSFIWLQLYKISNE